MRITTELRALGWIAFTNSAAGFGETEAEAVGKLLLAHGQPSIVQITRSSDQENKTSPRTTSLTPLEVELVLALKNILAAYTGDAPHIRPASYIAERAIALSEGRDQPTVEELIQRSKK